MLNNDLLYALFCLFVMLLFYCCILSGKLIQGAGYLADKARSDLLKLQNQQYTETDDNTITTTGLAFTTLSPANESQLAEQKQKVNNGVYLVSNMLSFNIRWMTRNNYSNQTTKLGCDMLLL